MSFSVVILPLTVTAGRAGDPVPQAAALAGNMGDVTSSPAVTKELLSAENQYNVQNIMNDLTYLLHALTSQEFKNLVNGTSKMLAPDFVSSLLGELPSFLDRPNPLRL
ncbi:hypothetical protein ABOM_002086 [Aspergillus bombycis]|uniref:Uncharacterized protein n=1 Tax=Aspergillus bombycis TaxID=109264 RepID=A0A1F8A929_9EURO|nr:hypothetical protein ABOM_002086 [Aspergillus bombycis]OGM48183.1 hypothetical protein ABOM_002086 [Aspergillus bombycis]